MAATTRKKSAPKKSSTASKPGAGAAVAETSKDATRRRSARPLQTVKPAAAAKSKTMKPAKKASEDGPSIASRVIRKVKKTASGAVAMAE